MFNDTYDKKVSHQYLANVGWKYEEGFTMIHKLLKTIEILHKIDN